MEKTINIKRNIIWLDNLRAFSTIAVVLLHVSAQMTYSFGKVPNIDWWASNLYESLTRFAVPSFVMITGVLTLGKNYVLKDFFYKKFSRILIPFIFWSFVYIAYTLVKIYFKTPTKLSWEFIVDFTVKKIAFGASYQMWYVYMLIGIYLIHPVINKWIINSTKKEQVYFLSLCLFSVVINYFPFTFLKSSIDFSYFSTFLGYLILGFFLFHENMKKDNLKMLILLIALYFLSYFIICYDTYQSSVKNNIFTEQYKPWDIIQSIAVFLLFKLNYFFNKENKILSFISKYSFGVYLIHVLIMDLLAKVGLAYFSFNPYFSIPVTALCTISISLIILYLIDKLPLGKYVVK